MPPAKIDVRQPSEFASGHIEGSRLVPLSTLMEASAAWDRAKPLTLVCKSGMRAERARQQLARSGFTSLSVLAGGVDAWRAAGKPLVAIEQRPWSMERKFYTSAAVLILLTLVLAYFFSTFFLLGTTALGAIGAFEAVSGSGRMASLFARLPWTRGTRAVK